MDAPPPLQESDIHPHLRARMEGRGVSLPDINETLANGWSASDAVAGTQGRVWVFEFGAQWEGRFYDEKEVTVYFKRVGAATIPLTVKARYGTKFPRTPGAQ